MENLIEEKDFQFLDEVEEDEEIKTFNNVMNKDEILQTYLKEIGKIKLLNKKKVFSLSLQHHKIHFLDNGKEILKRNWG